MIRRIVICAVLGCLLFLNSMALPQVVRHSLHHDQHSSSTHNSSICFWVCTAGQMEKSSTVLPLQPIYLIETLRPHRFSSPPAPLAIQQQARAPPTPSFGTRL